MATILKYVSKGGTIRMNGPLAHMRITELSGFELPAKNYEEIEYAGENGVTTTGSKDMARTMTISAETPTDQKSLQVILKALYYKGCLYCQFGSIRRRIECKPVNISDVERFGKSGIGKIVIQFQADYPHFSDYQDTVKSISGTNDLIGGEFTLPCVWTEWVNGGTVNNNGDMIVYPILSITADNATESSSATITITNETTGAVIKLDYVMQEGETVTVDLSTRRIRSSIRGNITNKISDDTVLSDFFLELGENKISFNNSATNQTLKTQITFSRLYLTAVR